MGKTRPLSDIGSAGLTDFRYGRTAWSGRKKYGAVRSGMCFTASGLAGSGKRMADNISYNCMV